MIALLNRKKIRLHGERLDGMALLFLRQLSAFLALRPEPGEINGRKQKRLLREYFFRCLRGELCLEKI